jgi:uncharacterized surface protein with fasciclin (FAS1) repeats
MSYLLTVRLARRAALACAVITLASACASLEKPVSLAETIAKTPELSTLNGLVKTAGLAETLQGPGPFTIFAPSDAAFKALKPGTLEALSKNPENVKDLLLFHAVSGAVVSKDVKNSNAKAVNGGALALAKSGDFVTVENAFVVKGDVMASNGVIHIIDTVLTPPKK